LQKIVRTFLLYQHINNEKNNILVEFGACQGDKLVPIAYMLASHHH
jgi:hypothetical protein